MGLSVIKCERTIRLENIALYSPSLSWLENIDDEGREKENVTHDNNYCFDYYSLLKSLLSILREKACYYVYATFLT
jgi:hypothetical protein